MLFTGLVLVSLNCCDQSTRTYLLDMQPFTEWDGCSHCPKIYFRKVQVDFPLLTTKGCCSKVWVFWWILTSWRQKQNRRLDRWSLCKMNELTLFIQKNWPAYIRFAKSFPTHNDLGNAKDPHLASFWLIKPINVSRNVWVLVRQSCSCSFKQIQLQIWI